MSDGEPRQMAEAMAELLQRFRPLLEERVTLIEGAARAAAEGTLDDGQRSDGYGAAHKLAGVLGTFGMAEGTEKARVAEQLLGDGHPVGAPEVERLQQIAAELRAMLEGIPSN